MKIIVTIALLLFFLQIKTMAQLPSGFTNSKVASGLTNPTNMTLSEDGRLFITEKNGSVRIMKDGELLDVPMISIDVDHFTERGLQSIVLDPDFLENQYFYLYYTVAGGDYNRISRFKADGDLADPTSEVVIIEMDPMEGYLHNGGAMIFDDVEKLLIFTGDGHSGIQSQGYNTLLGKVLRINKDGSIPENNPFIESTYGKYRAIYAFGLRNPFSAAKNNLSGQIIINDVGHASYEEVNILKEGGNYGWPFIEGPIGDNTPPWGNYSDPLYVYSHDNGCAIVGSTFYTPEEYVFPEEYHDKYIFADYCSNIISFLDPSTGEIIEAFNSGINSTIGLLTSHSGSLYILSLEGELWELQYTGSNIPFITTQPISQLYTVGESAEFEIVSGGGEPLQYQWLKNGIEIVGANSATFIYENVSLEDDNSVFTCKVSNNEGEILSDPATLNVTEKKKPKLFIDEPLNSYLYKAGQEISFKGYALNGDNELIPKTEYSWKIDFHHDTHSHPVIENLIGVDSAGFLVPLVGETSDNVWYRIQFTAKDPDGFEQTLIRDVFPEKALLKIQTDPPNINVNLDGRTIKTPVEFYSVVNSSRTLEAPPVQVSPPYLLSFNKWEDDNPDLFKTFTTPSESFVYTASYHMLQLGSGEGLFTQLFNGDNNLNEIPQKERIDGEINYDWGIGSPQPNLISENNFFIRWSGFIEIPEEGEYTFYVESDEKIRLWVNEILIIDNWENQDQNESSGKISLDSNSLHSFRLELFDEESVAFIKLLWSSDKIHKSVIPKYQFHPNNKPEVQITSPENEIKFIAGEDILIKGNATDVEDGNLTTEKLSWKIDLHTGLEIVNVVPETNNADSILLKSDLSLYDDTTDLFYRVYLKATDSHNVSSITFKDFYPNRVNVDITSNLAELYVTLGDQRITVPSQLSLISGKEYGLNIPQKMKVNGHYYVFSEWEEGGSDTSLNFIAPKVDTTLSLIYIPNRLEIFPNPTSKYLNLTWPNIKNSLFNISIINSAGQILISEEVEDNKIILDVGTLASGVYQVRLSRGGEIIFSSSIIKM